MVVQATSRKQQTVMTSQNATTKQIDQISRHNLQIRPLLTKKKAKSRKVEKE